MWCGFVVVFFFHIFGVGWGGAITSFALRSHTDAALLYTLLQFHRCVVLLEHILIWIGWGGVGWGKRDSEEVHNHKIVVLCVCTFSCALTETSCYAIVIYNVMLMGLAWFHYAPLAR